MLVLKEKKDLSTHFAYTTTTTIYYIRFNSSRGIKITHARGINKKLDRVEIIK